MAISPQTDLYLIKCPIEIDNMNQLTFNTKSEQVNYFSNLPHKLVQNITYQRKDNVIRFPAHIDTLLEYNYVMYRNNNYTNKYFYAYIVKMEYVNDNMTNIYIKCDVFQTWQFDLTYNKSFIEREHVNDDTIGKHTIPEGLETGEYITNGEPIDLFDYSTGSYIVIGATDFPVSVTPAPDRLVNGIYSGLYYIFAFDDNHATQILNLYASEGRLDYITCIFMIPKKILSYDITNRIKAYNIGNVAVSYIISSSTSWKFWNDTTITIPTSLNGYTPKNNKLFCYPFNCFTLSNNTGIDVVMNYEDFVDNSPSFTMRASITPGCSIKCIPLNYKKLSDTTDTLKSFNYGITGTKFPVCSWAGDTFTNWLTQNGANLAITGVTSAIQIGVGAAMMATNNMAGAGNVASGFSSIISSVSSVIEHAIVPMQTEGNINSGDVTFSSGKSVFTIFKNSIKSEYAEIIDNYFQLYGYKVNELKTPNITGRRNWNYVKMINPNIEALIPQEDLQEIKDMFSTGITLWHNSNTFLDYSQNNDII